MVQIFCSNSLLCRQIAGFIFFLPMNFSTFSSMQNKATLLSAITFQPFNILANSFLVTDWNGVYKKKNYLGCHQILPLEGKTHDTLRKTVSLQRSWAKLFSSAGTETQPTHAQKYAAEDNNSAPVSRKEQTRAITPYQSFKIWSEHNYSFKLHLAFANQKEPGPGLKSWHVIIRTVLTWNELPDVGFPL